MQLGLTSDALGLLLVLLLLGAHRALPHSPAAAAAATCSHLLRHSDSVPPGLPFSPPQLALHSPFYDNRWEAGVVRRRNGASFTATPSSRRGAGPANAGERHTAVRKTGRSPLGGLGRRFQAPKGDRPAVVPNTALTLLSGCVGERSEPELPRAVASIVRERGPPWCCTEHGFPPLPSQAGLLARAWVLLKPHQLSLCGWSNICRFRTSPVGRLDGQQVVLDSPPVPADVQTPELLGLRKPDPVPLPSWTS